MCDADDEDDVGYQDNAKCLSIAMMVWMMMNMCVSMFNYEFPVYRVRAGSASHVYV